MAQSKQFIFTNLDIDGSLSYLLLKWITGREIPYKCSSMFNIESDFSDWYRANGEKYERISKTSTCCCSDLLLFLLISYP